MKANPDAHPLFHSDRGFQYTNRTFHHMLEDAGIMQSMSRVAHCIDNCPMEGFWGILKRESYYGKRFTSKQELVQMIRDYIYYYNTQRVQRNLGVVTPSPNFLVVMDKTMLLDVLIDAFSWNSPYTPYAKTLYVTRRYEAVGSSRAYF